MSIAELAMEYIRAHGTARSDEIEKELRISNVAAHLNPHVARGELVRCKVERPGKAPVNEYRISASAPVAAFVPQGIPAPRKRGVALIKVETTLGAEPGARALAAHPAVVPAVLKLGPPATTPYLGPIEKGVVLPPSKRPTGELRRHMEGLQVGDSFATTFSTRSVYANARSLGIKVTRRPEGKGIRVWRYA